MCVCVITMAVTFKSMPLDNFQNCFGVVAGIDDDGFVRLRISDNVAIALQHADRKDFVDEF